MFRRLKIKLTLINVAVVGLILLFFMGQVYFLTQRDINQQITNLMQLVANQVSSGDLQPLADIKHHRLNYFYVIVGPSGAITSISPFPPPPVPGGLADLIDKALQTAQMRGIVRQGKEVYTFQKAVSQQNSGTVLVFSNNEANEETMDHLLGALALTGCIALALVIFGGWFMAEKALIPIKNSWQRQKDFTADASHEMRSPLAVIQTNLDLVMGNQDKTVGSQNRWLENIQTETGRMTRLVDDLLFLARADSDQETLHMNMFPLLPAIREALRPLEPLAASHNINLLIPDEADIYLNGDETRIKQLVVILIDNAIKYTPTGGTVKLEVSKPDHHVEIIVTDTGEGIDPNNLDRVFERFYRGDKARNRQNGGTGLGLAIARRIVFMHRGNIQASSSPGKGTTFRVTLPR